MFWRRCKRSMFHNVQHVAASLEKNLGTMQLSLCGRRYGGLCAHSTRSCGRKREKSGRNPRVATAEPERTRPITTSCGALAMQFLRTHWCFLAIDAERATLAKPAARSAVNASRAFAIILTHPAKCTPNDRPSETYIQKRC